MKRYRQKIIVKAEVMTLFDYHNLRGWDLPYHDREGFLVVYPNYESWMPKEYFEQKFEEVSEE